MNWLPSHFRTLIPGFTIVFLLAALTRHLSEKKRIWMLRGLMMILFVMECVKQLLAIENYSSLYLPFHYSTSFYICMALYAFGSGRVRHYGTCSLYVGGFFLLASMVCSPSSIVSNPTPELLRSSFYNFYSLFFHLVVLFVWATLLFNVDYISEKRDPFRYASFLLGWAGCAIPASYLTGFNYAGILSSYIPPLETLRLTCGNVIYLFTYATLALLVASLLIFVHHYVLYTNIQSELESSDTE